MLNWLKTILADAYTDDIDKKVSDEIGKNFVARADFNSLNAQKKSLEDTLKERDGQIEKLNNSAGDYESLKTKIQALEQAAHDREQAAIAEKQRAELFTQFEAAAGNKKFVNDYTKNAIFENFRTELSKDANKGKSATDVFKQLTNDKEGIFQSENPTVNAGGIKPSTPDLDDKQIDAIMGIPSQKT